MSTQTNKAVVRRYYEEVLNAGHVDALDELATRDYVEHDPLPGQGDGRDDLKRRATTLLAAFSPLTFIIEDLIAEDDKVVVRWSSSGTHNSDFLGIAATHRPYTISGIDIHRLEGNQLAEHWHVVDQLSQLQQLGLIPAPA
ncbi:ester cyclase [Nostocoides sp. HKS02]|uniref:ester cyclase n=1 Tax=Nostocoides sp. HKS02 TaxID=1813880 RepID=UPI0012B494FE|nr:ester cyclase [Tetrasphaera sp. HKS02]QGN58039.1 ester cyclase [Tetrasphaera sp. HKS02]